MGAGSNGGGIDLHDPRQSLTEWKFAGKMGHERRVIAAGVGGPASREGGHGVSCARYIGASFARASRNADRTVAGFITMIAAISVGW
ncbi:hypothetical protein Vau01_075730 [Virgisporangium aurantiacum]|uniref:Uncharacterized protein n=1 Tax=Virgisporangium aurantiacum TaxID=175570 RepID=A0A8J4E5M8_9ACTN|nr:hypothetical protein Vau01_075730 [Virgisporangium aurantiacum]